MHAGSVGFDGKTRDDDRRDVPSSRRLLHQYVLIVQCLVGETVVERLPQQVSGVHAFDFGKRQNIRPFSAVERD